MTVHDKTAGEAKLVNEPLDQKSLDFIERISYFEHLAPTKADNDNKTAPSDAKGSACFDSWAIPDFLRG